MKISNVLILSSFLLSLSVYPASAETAALNSTIKEDVPVPAKVVPKRTAADEEKILEQRKRTTAARKDLNGSSWQVDIRSMDPKGKSDKDKFTFQDGMFKSDYYIGRGYTPTNYSITMAGGDETEEAIWETMLSSKEGQIFIHGQWEKDKMNGNITEQLEGGKKVVERYFTTEARKAIPAESKKTDEAPSKAEVEEESSPTAPLVSKEAENVAPFNPGTTEEVKS